MGFKGIFPALVTPFDNLGKFHVNAMAEIIEMNIEKGVHGFYVGGSTGESYLLSPEERKTVLEAVMKIVDGRVDVIANIGMFSTVQSIELAKHADSVGVSAISAVPPFYFKFGIEEYVEYYNNLVEETNAPLIIYNVPALSGIHFSRQDIEKMFQNDKIIGLKHTSYDLFQMQKILEEHPDKTVFIGHDEIFLSAYAAGARAAIGSTFNFMSEKFIRMEQLFQERKLEEALHIQGEVNDVVEVLSEIGVFKGVKEALRLQGIDAGTCRKPFLPLKRSQIEKLHQVLERTGCL